MFRRQFEVFLFEDEPAQDRGAPDIYLAKAGDCDVYVALLGIAYGFEDDEGVSPTEREFDRAVARRRHRLAFVKNISDHYRHPKMVQFIRKVEGQVTRRRFVGAADLTAELYRSLIKILEDEGVLAARPFDASQNQLSFDLIDADRVEEFAKLAASKRQLRLKKTGGAKETLAQLDLFDENALTNAAVLLFSDASKRVARGAEVNCQHYAGTEALRPSLSHKVFGGSVFDQADAAVAFVMDRLALSVGVRDAGPQVDTSAEIPHAAVAEAIINAVAHRNYRSASAVQVTVFADRVEVSNPGELPRGLTPEQLRGPHSSIPQNPLLAEALFLSGYIEKSGTGTTEMIRQCKAAGLPEPTFEQRGDQWTVTLWRDWLTDAYIANASLNTRQISALAAVKANGAIDNTAYQDLTGASKRTATRDLGELVEKGILVRTGGDMGRGAGYQKAKARPDPAARRAATPKRPAAKRGQKGAKGAKAAVKTRGHKGATTAKKAKKPK